MIIEFLKRTESFFKNGNFYEPGQRVGVDKEIGQPLIDSGDAKEVQNLYHDDDPIEVIIEKKKRKRITSKKITTIKNKKSKKKK